MNALRLIDPACLTKKVCKTRDSFVIPVPVRDTGITYTCEEHMSRRRQEQSVRDTWQEKLI
jgi:hypothetical protein